MDWERGVLPGKAGDDICSSSDGAQEHIRLDPAVDIVVALWLEWGAGGEDGVERGERVSVTRLNSTFLQSSQPPGTSTQNGHPDSKRRCQFSFPLRTSDTPQRVDKVPENRGRWDEGRAIIENHCSSNCQCTDHPVPHHPPRLEWAGLVSTANNTK